MKFILILFLAFCFSCTTTPPEKSTFTPAVAKQLLQKGVTTQSQVLAQWGSPNMVTRNSAGQEVWSYSKQSFDSSQKSGGIGFLIGGGSGAVSQSSTSAFEVLITFDAQGTVQDFNVISSQY